MDSTIHPADLDQCVAPLDDDDLRALRQYWEQVTDELCPLARPVPRAVPLPSDGRRERREVRRTVGRIAAAGQTRIRVLPVAPTPGWPGEAA
jgi:hypothetical protein